MVVCLISASSYPLVYRCSLSVLIQASVCASLQLKALHHFYAQALKGSQKWGKEEASHCASVWRRTATQSDECYQALKWTLLLVWLSRLKSSATDPIAAGKCLMLGFTLIIWGNCGLETRLLAAAVLGPSCLGSAAVCVPACVFTCLRSLHLTVEFSASKLPVGVTWQAQSYLAIDRPAAPCPSTKSDPSTFTLPDSSELSVACCHVTDGVSRLLTGRTSLSNAHHIHAVSAFVIAALLPSWNLCSASVIFSPIYVRVDISQHVFILPLTADKLSARASCDPSAFTLYCRLINNLRSVCFRPWRELAVPRAGRTPLINVVL